MCNFEIQIMWQVLALILVNFIISITATHAQVIKQIGQIDNEIISNSEMLRCFDCHYQDDTMWCQHKPPKTAHQDCDRMVMRRWMSNFGYIPNAGHKLTYITNTVTAKPDTNICIFCTNVPPKDVYALLQTGASLLGDWLNGPGDEDKPDKVPRKGTYVIARSTKN